MASFQHEHRFPLQDQTGTINVNLDCRVSRQDYEFMGRVLRRLQWKCQGFKFHLCDLHRYFTAYGTHPTKQRLYQACWSDAELLKLNQEINHFLSANEVGKR